MLITTLLKPDLASIVVYDFKDSIMVVYNLMIKHFLFPQLFILFYIFVIITNFFSLLTPSLTFTSAISFNFTSFDSGNTNISYERAYPENQAIQLTGSKPTMGFEGRATYFKPMHLWDKASGNLTDFTTHFSFIIDSRNQTVYGDGLAFFLAPDSSKIPMDSKGSALGLASNDQSLNSTDNPFVAVEFDIFQNTWDPPGEHVGIDINSMKSVANVTWLSNIAIREGKRNEAWISYNSSSSILSVVFTGFTNNISVMQFLSHSVNLSLFLPEWVTFGFSAATGDASATHTIYSWDFSSRIEIDSITNVEGPNALMPNPAPEKRKENTLGIVVGFIAGGCVLVGGLALVLFVLRNRNKRDKEDNHVAEEFPRGREPMEFSYNELANATNNFNEERRLGQGGSGTVYKGILRDTNSFVAVKRIFRGSREGLKQYASEINVISRLRHRNLVQLIGWCHERREELLVVYDFMSNGSLDLHLFREETVLNWEYRYKIVQNLASALLYLHHEGCEQCVLHRDIKSSNIMLDSNFNAKLGDFGLARLVDHAKGARTTTLAGTRGYMDPVCVAKGKASRESDVYSFGIVALEIACGRKPIEWEAQPDQVFILDWVRELYERGEVLKAIDRRLEHFDEQKMERLLILGLSCTNYNQNTRPSISQAIQLLNFEVPLHLLRFDTPASSYHTSTENEATSSWSNTVATNSRE
ncbi:L-type lectin-domain containing receptor kinase IX.1-like [Fagus crenata]